MIENNFELDKTAIEAAFYNETDLKDVLSGPPLALLLGDAFNGMVERLQRLSLFHDLACSYKNCSGIIGDTELSRMWNILANIDNEQNLISILTKTTSNFMGWRDVFWKIRNNYNPLKATLNETAFINKATNIDLLEIKKLHRSSYKLLRILSLAKENNRNYQNGTFRLSTGNVLKNSLHPAKREVIAKMITDELSHLNSERLKFDQDLKSLVGTLIDVQNQSMREKEAQIKIAQLLEDIQKLDQSREAHGKALIENNLFAELSSSLKNIEGVIENAKLLSVAFLGKYKLSGSNAKASNQSSAKDIRQIAANATPIYLTANQILNLDVKGKWSPTCALRRVKFAQLTEEDILSPNGTVDDLSAIPPGALAGPEGFAIFYNGSTFQATTNGYQTVSAPSSKPKQIKICDYKEIEKAIKNMDANPEFKYYPGPEWMKIETIKKKFCTDTKTVSYGVNSDTYNSNNGGEYRSTLSLASGLKLEKTPFPEAPAGSLLVVEMPHNEKNLSNIRRVHLVHSPSTTIINSYDSDFYFVVNDTMCDPSDQADSINQLEIDVNAMISAKEVAKDLIQRMAYTINHVRTMRSKFIERGEILPAESSSIRTEALLDLIKDESGKTVTNLSIDSSNASVRIELDSAGSISPRSINFDLIVRT